MTRLSLVALLHMLCALAFASASCRVYEPELIEQLAAGGRGTKINTMNRTQLAADSATSSDAGEPVIVPACGNGQVDDHERCDIAIKRGEPGACPDGCNEHDGCVGARLMGQRCGARCVPNEISERVADDGCCPSGATAATDSDCSGTCGNGVLEKGETCDPIETCPKPGSCTTQKACTVARLLGAADSCSARCQELPISECTSGDGCCPDGCGAQSDSDCPLVTEPPLDAGPATQDPVLCMNGQQCTEEQLTRECTMVHAGGQCHSCDCTYCPSNVMLCEAAAQDTKGCSRVVECALQNHCQGLACLCGPAVPYTVCQLRQEGPCVSEIRALAGTRDFLGIVWNASTPGTPLETAMNLVACRAEHCAETCGL